KLPELDSSAEQSDVTIYCNSNNFGCQIFLADFINLFGRCGGFDNLLGRFRHIQEKPIPVPVIYTYLRPFRLCSNMIGNDVRKYYISPIVDIVLDVIKCLTEGDIRQLLRDNQRSSFLGDFSIIRILHLCS
ncbi:unnamed protein product, partial [Hymenolepis diminuta]